MKRKAASGWPTLPAGSGRAPRTTGNSRNLRLARQQALTDRQRQMLELYYDQGLTMGQIALKLNLNRSTVSRTLSRAKDKLYRCLRYSL